MQKLFVHLLMVACAFIVHGQTHAQLTFSFSRIADTDSLIPNGLGRFSGFNLPTISGGDVAFRGAGPRGQVGIYTNIGGLTRVSDLNTPVPGGTGNFIELNTVSLSGGNVAFFGIGNSSQRGVYTDIGGLNVVVDLDTPAPGGGTFDGLGSPSMDAGHVAFIGVASGPSAIYSTIGGIHEVITQTTPIPGGSGSFTSFGPPVLNGGNIAFEGHGVSQNGIYSDYGGLHQIADLGTAIPGGTGNFSGFGALSMDNGNTTFHATGNSQAGIYLDNGTLGVVADLNTAIPGGTGNFTSFLDDTAIDGGNIAFAGLGSGQRGIYTTLDGSLAKVVEIGDVIDGKTVNGLFIGSQGISANQLAIDVRFSDGPNGIYVATGISSLALPANPVIEGMIGYWQGEGNANDSVSVHHGNMNGGVGFTSGVYGQAFNLDGIDDFIDFGNSGGAFDFDGDDSFSLSLWFQSDSSTGAYETLISKEDGNRPTFNALMATDGTMLASLQPPGSGTFTAESLAAFNDGLFHHLSVVVDQETDSLRLYIDGQLVDSSAIPDLLEFVEPSTSLLLGARIPLAPDRFFKGALDDIAIYNRALTPTEIQSIFNAAVPEPAGLALFAAVLIGLFGYLGRWNRSRISADHFCSERL